MQHCQVIIIGGGPGGYESAIRLSQYGISSLLMEKERLGGLCLNWGCIPTKALVKSAELYSEILNADNFGLPKPEITLQYNKVWQRKNAVVEQLTSGIEFLFSKHDIPVIKATAVSVTKEKGNYIVTTLEGESYSSEYVILATGSETKELPGIKIDEKDILSSTGILKMQELPKELAIIGGGVIGCEFASIFSTFGVQVTLIEFLPRIMATEEEEISKRLTRQFKKTGVKVLTNTGVQGITKKEKRLELILSNETTLYADKVLLSVGRKPINNLNWKGINIKEEKDAILIDDFMQTNCDKIYAVGDVTGKLQLAHTAGKQGLIAVEHIASCLYPEKHSAPKEPLNYINIPRCTFTHPEIASVGYTETEAEKKFGEIVTGKFPFSANGKAVATGNINGFVKTIARKDTSELVGMHILGPNAAELIAQGTIMIINKNKAEDIDSFVFAHPTLSEAILEAMEDLQNKSIHKI